MANGAATAAFWTVVFGTLLLLGTLGTVSFSKMLWLQSVSIFTISGVPPDPAGEVTASAGAGISVSSNVPANEVLIANTGVLSNVAGTGIAVSSATGDVTISNTGVTSATAGMGISVTPSGTGDVTIANTGVITVAGEGADGGGNFALTAGLGLSSTVGVPANGLTLANTGVLSNVAGTGISVSGATGDVTITNAGVTSAVAGSGIGVSAATGAVTFSNTGVTSLAAGTGIGVSASTGAVTVSNTGVTSNGADAGIIVTGATGASLIGHELTIAARLPDSSPSGTHVRFLQTYGLGIAAVTNTWYTTESTLFSTVFIPGLVAGDDGQGAAGSSWMVPIFGAYQVAADCMFQINYTPGDYYTFEMALNMGASTLDPTISGFILPGGHSAASFFHTGAVGILTFPLSVSAIVQAGCTGCPVAVGQFLTMHVRTSSSLGGPFSASCRIQVSREK